MKYGEAVVVVGFGFEGFDVEGSLFVFGVDEFPLLSRGVFVVHE